MSQVKSFRRELCELLNRHSRENGSDTPDFILASYLDRCLANFDETMSDRSEWYDARRGQCRLPFDHEVKLDALRKTAPDAQLPETRFCRECYHTGASHPRMADSARRCTIPGCGCASFLRGEGDPPTDVPDHPLEVGALVRTVLGREFIVAELNSIGQAVEHVSSETEPGTCRSVAYNASEVRVLRPAKR